MNLSKLISALGILFFVNTSIAFNISSDFYTLEKDSPVSFLQSLDSVILETENKYLLKTPLTNFESYDYYFMQIPHNKNQVQWFYENLNVVFEEPGEFLVLEIRNENQLKEAATRAHDAGHFCGMLKKLSPAPMELNKKQAPIMVRELRDDVKLAVEKVEINNILETMKVMVSWGTRYESDPEGVKTAQWLTDIYKDLIPADRDDVQIELVDHRGSKQQSYIIRILGTETPEKKVILGSHIDSINRDDLKDAPGADDNASGTSTNMEVFRVLMATNFKPKSTIEIHGYGAEEIGLVGSKEMARDYKLRGEQVISMVQFDMNGYTSTGDRITFITNKTDRGLTSQLENLVRMYNSIPSGKGRLIFGSSDHASWNREGFPVAFPTENTFAYNRKIHTKDDNMGVINSPNQIKEFGKLGVAYLMHFAD